LGEIEGFSKAFELLEGLRDWAVYQEASSLEEEEAVTVCTDDSWIMGYQEGCSSHPSGVCDQFQEFADIDVVLA